MVESETNLIKLEQHLKQHNIDLQGFLGKGSYSNVQTAFSHTLNKTIAVKVIDTKTQSEYVRRFLPREIELVKKLDHINIVKVHQVIKFEQYVCLAEEFADGGDLLQKITKNKRVSEVDARFIFRQLVEALQYLKTLEIVHRDLKCENVFLDKHDNVKLGDFGFARHLRRGECSNTFCGSRAYVAPEILRAVSYSGCTVDVWSAGVVLYVMVTGVMPYDDRYPQKMVDRMLGHRIRFPKIDLSLELKTLVYEILHPYPPSRPTYAEMCQSRWLANTAYVVRDGKNEVRPETLMLGMPTASAQASREKASKE